MLFRDGTLALWLISSLAGPDVMSITGGDEGGGCIWFLPVAKLGLGLSGWVPHPGRLQLAPPPDREAWTFLFFD